MRVSLMRSSIDLSSYITRPRNPDYNLPPPPPGRTPNVLADYLGNTAADIALSLNNEAIYRRVRDAGLRSGPFFPWHFQLPRRS